MSTSRPNILKIFCAIKGSDSPFLVSIDRRKKVANLEKKIIKYNQDMLKGINVTDFTLYQVDLPIPIQTPEGVKQALQERAQKLNPEEALCSLSELSTIYTSAPPDGAVHIIAQYSPRNLKRPRSPSTEQDGPSKKKIATHVTLPDGMDEQILAIHNAIRNIPDDLDPSDPATFTMLPFPSPHPAPAQRFRTKNIDCVDFFRYMGRSKFLRLKKGIESVKFVDRKSDICLYGSSGSGKSHVLAALVCQLIREGKRVVYIPDCWDLLKNPRVVIRVALCTAFYNNPKSLETIKSARTIEDLLEFWETRNDIYLVVDQLNALEATPDGDILRSRKEKAKDWLGKMSFRHRYIYGISASGRSSQDIDLKQASTVIISFIGGMNRKETEQWFKHYSNKLPSLSKHDLQLIKYITGCIPLLLRPLFKFKNKVFDQRKFLVCDDLIRINNDITNFYESKEREVREHPIANTFFGIMNACLRGGYILVDPESLYDLRYFYVDNERGHYTCGIAFESLLLIFRRPQFQRFFNSNWYHAVSETMNIIVRGVITEQICLDYISNHGLLVVDSHLTKMEVIAFDTGPNWDKQLSNNDATLQIYIPTTYKFPSISAVILWLDPRSKAAHLYPIQMTLSKTHNNSEDVFYAENWRSWTRPIEFSGFTVHSTFIWIDKEQPATQHEGTVTVPARLMRPEHQSIHIGLRQIERIANALSLD